MFQIDQFTYELPDALIAQKPAEPRDSSRLMVVNRDTGEIGHAHFADLPNFLGDGDVLVRNNTKVLPARIFGRKAVTGGQCEILLIRQVEMNKDGCVWECLTKPGLKMDQEVVFGESVLRGKCVKLNEYTRLIEFTLNGQDFYEELNAIGHTPIPPYIEWENQDEEKLREVYQTTYAKVRGSVAAPTAGLHFTPELDAQLQKKGVQIEEVTLHVGLGTFLPLQDEQMKSGQLHSEWYDVTNATAERLNQAKLSRKRIIAVGTTTTRVLESCAHDGSGQVKAGSDETTIFIQPGFQFQFVDALITNFHLPKSSLLMLISAFVSEPNTRHEFVNFATSVVGRAYQVAIQEKYRFYSFGDGMLIY